MEGSPVKSLAPKIRAQELVEAEVATDGLECLRVFLQALRLEFLSENFFQ